jgi:hypothetical protein
MWCLAHQMPSRYGAEPVLAYQSTLANCVHPHIGWLTSFSVLIHFLERGPGGGRVEWRPPCMHRPPINGALGVARQTFLLLLLLLLLLQVERAAAAVATCGRARGQGPPPPPFRILASLPYNQCLYCAACFKSEITVFHFLFVMFFTCLLVLWRH